MERFQFLNNIESELKKGADVALSADFDGNVSHGGSSGGLDPRDSFLDAKAGQAFEEIITSGRDVTIITSRGAKDAYGIIKIPGISIVGTLGWETLDTQGNSHIHPRFQKYQEQITDILGEVRQRFLAEQLGLSTQMIDEPNIELKTPHGIIILQRKGYNDMYPEGINLTWALNLVTEEERRIYQEALAAYYHEAFDQYTIHSSQAEQAALQQMCGLMYRTGKTSAGLSTLDIEIRPTLQSAKAKAMIQIMRDPKDPKRQVHFKDMPSHNIWIYSGDHPVQDVPPMQVGHLASRFSSGAYNVYGSWSRPAHELGRPIPKNVDLVVEGVSGNADLLKDIASIMTRYPRSKAA